MPPRLLIISREYPPFIGGGIGTYAHRWARLLARRAAAGAVRSSGGAGGGGAWGPPLVVTTGPEGRMVEAEEDGITVVRLPLVAWKPRRVGRGGPGGSGERGGGERGGGLEQDWSAPHPAIATPEVEAAFRAFHPTAVFAMQVARALPRILARHEVGAIEAPDTGALHWFWLNARRNGFPAGIRAGEERGGGEERGADARVDGRRRALPPIITHLHSPTEWIEAINGAESGRQVDELRRMEADVVRWSDGIVCPSRALAEWAAAHWGLDRSAIAVIPYPIGELADDPPPPAPEPAPDEPLRLLYIGRLERRKGVDTLFAAFAEAARRASGRQEGGGGGQFRWRLDLAGRDTHDPATGELFGRAHFERLIPPELRGHVTLHGELPPAEVRRLLGEAHAAVAPSPLDNFPNTCMEAMSAGRPVIAAAAGGAAEMIEHRASGLLFAPGDSGDLAGRLLELAAMAPEARRAMGRAARDRILTLCGDDRVLEARLRHIASVASRDPGLGGMALRGHGLSDADGQPPSASPPPLILNRGAASDAELAPLVHAVTRGGVRFAHGWARDIERGRGIVRVFGTPWDGSLDTGADPGPIAIDRALAEDLGLSERAVLAPHEILARLIAAAPHDGAVVPEAVIPTDAARADPEAPFQSTATGRSGPLARLVRLVGRLRL